MRKLKFRAWDGLAVRYDVTGFEHGKENEMAGVFLDGEYYAIVEDINSGQFTFHPPATVMQFTGLTDKKGKDIYDGDVVRFDVRASFEAGSKPHFNQQSSVSIGPRETSLGGWDCAYCYNIGIIGNIYENPELMEKSS